MYGIKDETVELKISIVLPGEMTTGNVSGARSRWNLCFVDVALLHFDAEEIAGKPENSNQKCGLGAKGLCRAHSEMAQWKEVRRFRRASEREIVSSSPSTSVTLS